jgi:hypothetical protein
MSRTPLFAAVQKALARSLSDSSVVWPQSSALTRRKLLRLSAAAAGAAALSPVFEWSAYAKKKKRHGKHGPYSIAIIGGGVAGLTAAYSAASRRRDADRVRGEQSLGWAHVHDVRLL